MKEYYIFLLILQTGMIGAFVSLDFLLFFLFWEVMLVPMYFLIGIWGSDRRLYSAIKFFLYTLVGSVVMLLGILALYFYNYSATGVYTFDITQFQKLNLPFDLQWWIFLAFFLGLRDQGPDVPVPHLAARRAHRRPDGRLGHPGGRSAEDGDVRVRPLLRCRSCPTRRAYFVPMMAVLSIVGIVYGALVAHGAAGLEAAGGLLVGQPHGAGACSGCSR